MFKVRLDYQRVKRGDTFGKLEVIGEPFDCRLPVQKLICVVVQCGCGECFVASCRNLLRPHTDCCFACRNVTHGATVDGRSRLHRIWMNMRTRCSGRDEQSRTYYQEKGVTVCAEWQEFEPFRDWSMANGYSDDLEIDRIGGALVYSPVTCRWATRAEQMRNTSANRWIEAFGERKIVTDWSRDTRCSVSPHAILERISKGMSPEMAITVPPQKRGRVSCLI